jgi:hypothetical protein
MRLSKREGIVIMARPIEATPVLKGKDADAFLTDMRLTAPVSTERKAWLDSLAQASKSAEQKKSK